MFKATSVFQSYDKVTSPLPARVWVAFRVIAIGVVLVAAAFLTFAPTIGLKLFWGLIIPITPAILVIAPGFWRQICPLATINQLPRQFGFSRNLELKGFLKNKAYTIAVAAFFVLVALRVQIFNTNGYATAGMAVGAIVLAFLGGVVFKGRSGWCGTFCPLGPIQRNYGHAPTLNIPNGHCTTCVGCQKNCYDFNPKAAIFDDLYDEDPQYAGQHRFFMAMMPGMIFGYFMQLGTQDPYGLYLLYFCAATLASVGSYYLVTSFFGLNIYKTAALFSAGAVAEFYWFAGPIICNTVGDFIGFKPSMIAIMTVRSIGLMVALVLAVQGLMNEVSFEKAQKAEEDRQRELMKSRQIEMYEVLEQESGLVISALPEQSLLSVIQSSGIEISASCKSGLCGADPVAIIEGEENLSPPTDDELATLRRLGLEGKARLACSCQVRGSVVIHRDPSKVVAQPKTPGKPAPATLPAAAKLRGVSSDRVNIALKHAGAPQVAVPQPPQFQLIQGGRQHNDGRSIVIIGNGAAGTTAAEALRGNSDNWRITLVSNEPYHFYNRMALGKVVSGKMGPDGLLMMPEDWYGENDISVKLNTRVAAIDRAKKVVTTLTGETLPYDSLILAMGARARMPRSTFLARSNCFVLRSNSDAVAIYDYVRTRGVRSAVVLGGGVLGVEAAESLSQLGLSVAVVNRRPRLMDQLLDDEGAELLRRYLDRCGVSAVTGSDVDSYEGHPELRSVRLKDGRILEADIFVACAGNVPNTELAKACGLDVGAGIKVDNLMRTSDANIYAVGDVAEFRRAPAGLWPVAVLQAKTAVSSIVGQPEPYIPQRSVVHLKSEGVDVYGFGDLHNLPPDAEIVTAPPFAPAWWRLGIQHGQIIAATYAGQAGSASYLGKLLRSQTEIAPQLDNLRSGNFEALKKIKVA